MWWVTSGGKKSVAALRILFMGVIKKLKLKIVNKKRTWIYQVIDKKKKNYIFLIFQILNCYMIVHYEYLLPMWIAMIILFC